MWFLDRCSWCLDYPDARGGNGRCVCVCVCLCVEVVCVCVYHTHTHTHNVYLHLYSSTHLWRVLAMERRE